MEERIRSIESLLENALDYSKTTFELVKLKLIDKVSDIISSYIPLFVVFILFAFVLLFINIGLALFVGELLGNISYEFFAVGAGYFLIILIFYFFMRKWLKRILYNRVVRIISKEII